MIRTLIWLHWYGCIWLYLSYIFILWKLLWPQQSTSLSSPALHLRLWNEWINKRNIQIPAESKRLSKYLENTTMWYYCTHLITITWVNRCEQKYKNTGFPWTCSLTVVWPFQTLLEKKTKKQLDAACKPERSRQPWPHNVHRIHPSNPTTWPCQQENNMFVCRKDEWQGVLIKQTDGQTDRM